jgi:Flp pilus assembly protein TadD
MTRPLATVGPPPIARPAPPPRPARSRGWPLLAALLLAAAVAGAALAYMLTRGDGSSQPTTRARPRVTTVLQTVTKPTGQTTTVIQQTTVQAAPPTTATAATPPPSGASGHALNDQGYTRMQAGDFAGAVPLLQQAVQKLRGTGPSDPYEGYANYNLGYSLLQVGRCAEAITYLQRADSLEPSRHEPRQALHRAEKCA